MSIHAYTGLPGSGKSYNVVGNVVVPALRERRVVVTNIPLHMDGLLEMFPDVDVRVLDVHSVAAEPELIEEVAPPGCVLIIDELWRLFPAGQKVNNVPEQFKSLLAEHRHRVDEAGRSMQIVFVTQDLAQIGAFARQLVEQTFLHTKLGHLGASGSFRVRIFHGPVTGANPGKGSEIRMILGKYRPEIYRLYKSHTMSQSSSEGADESVVDKRGNIWRRPGIWIAAVICVIALGWAVYALKGVFGSDSVLVSESLKQAGVNAPARSKQSISSMEEPISIGANNQPAGCFQLVFGDGRIQCECVTSLGQRVREVKSCLAWMSEALPNYGGPSAKAENIAYLNGRSVSTAAPAVGF